MTDKIQDMLMDMDPDAMTIDNTFGDQEDSEMLDHLLKLIWEHAEKVHDLDHKEDRCEGMVYYLIKAFKGFMIGRDLEDRQVIIMMLKLIHAIGRDQGRQDGEDDSTPADRVKRIMSKLDRIMNKENHD